MQNEINQEFSAEQLQEFDGFLAGLESLSDKFQVLSTEEKAGYVKAPAGSGDWMKNLLVRSEQNLDKLPRSYDPALVKRDLKLIADLDARMLRLHRVLERFESAQFLARSDAFSALLGVRRTLREAGVSGVDDSLNEGLERFFNRTSKSESAPAAK